MMALSDFLRPTLLFVLAVMQFACVRAVSMHASSAVDDIAMYLEGSDRQWHGQAKGLCTKDLTSILRDEAVQRLQDLGRVSDKKEFLQRTFLSSAAVRAGQLIRSWMTDAGLSTWVDDFGNVHGRADGLNASAPALLIGSHLDTVIDAGRYDGALGIVSAIAAVKALQKSGRLVDFPRPVEVIAFSDEEGIRYQSTFLGSGAIAGIFSPTLLQVEDKSGVTIQDALKGSGLPGTAESVSAAKYDSSAVWGYLEVHIEQGPLLESKGLPLGVVDAIAGQTRLRVSIKGLAGHAGTVPMAMRRDPMPAAALAIVAIDDLCMHPEQILSPGLRNDYNQDNVMVCTVGEIASWPGASNVISGEVIFTIDVRSKSDRLRELAVLRMENTIYDICKDRAVKCNVEKKHEAKTVVCDAVFTEKLRRAATSANTDLFVASGRQSVDLEKAGSVPLISSGAGHDALAMAQLTEVGMLFVRCSGGHSHSPLEDVMKDDIWAAGLALYSFLEMEF